MKKILPIILISLLMVIICNQYSLASSPISNEVVSNSLQEDYEEAGTQGTAPTINNSGQKTSQSMGDLSKALDTVGNVLSWIVAVLPFTVNKLLAVATTGSLTGIFSIENLLLGEYNILHINFFNVDSLQGTYADLIKTISQSVAVWYISIRNLAAIGCAIILIYVGIRMALVSTSEDSAKYKIMLKNWTIGVILIFFLQYIVIILISISELFINMIKETIINNSNSTKMEETILKNAFSGIASQKGFNKTLYVITYIMLVYYQLKFFIIYISRVIKVAFLMMISPLICMTYSIDTMKDNKAQAFNNWLKQIIMEIFLQPIHLSIYIVFMYSAGEIATKAPIVAIAFLGALSNGEKIVRRVFKVEGKGLKDIKFKK